MDVKDFINQKYKYALVGASTDKNKYGYTVVNDLAQANYNIVGVNPKYNEIEGIKIYSTLEEVPGKIDVVIFVVPPGVGLPMLSIVKKIGVDKVWFQPGAESSEIVEACKKLRLDVVADGSCIMIARRSLSL